MRASSRTHSTAGWFGRDWRYVLLACAVLASIFAVALAIGSWSGMLTTANSSAPARAAPPGRPVTLNTGRIVFTTTYGKTCRQMVIDNDTWHVTAGGTVDCADFDGSSGKSAAPAGAERLLDLRNGFGAGK